MKQRFLLVALIIFCAVSLSAAQSARHELVQTFTSSTPEIADQFGEAITVGDALDGWPLFVGSPNLPGKGRVERFINTGANWEATNCVLTQAGAQKATGFGESLATSGVGVNALLVVGEPYFNKKGGFTDQGRVSVFKRDANSICLSRVATLNAPVDAANQLFGASVDMVVGATESLIIVGAPTVDEAGTGAAYIYSSVDGGKTWILQTSLASNPAGVGTGFGYDVAIDGADYTPTAMVGAFHEMDTSIPEDPQELGAAYVYRRQSGTWAEDQRITPPSYYSTTQFGWSVDVAVSSTRTFVIGSNACGSCGNIDPKQRLFVYERLESGRAVTYQEDMFITSKFSIGEDLVLKNQPGDDDGFFMAFTSNDYYYELWERVDQYYWQAATTSIPETAGNRIAVATSAGFEPHLAVGQASVNTAWISAPSANQFELLSQGDFGLGSGANAGLSRKWKGSNLTNDGRRCPAEVGCHYQFKGSATENSLLKQVINLNNHSFNAGDMLTLSGDFNTKSAKANLIVTLAITEDGTVQKYTYTLDAPTIGWQTVSLDSHTVCNSPTKIVLTLRNKSKAGVIKVDNLSLNLAAPVNVFACRLPLPVAP